MQEAIDRNTLQGPNAHAMVKVALIDDGVCPEHDILCESIDDGWPGDTSQTSSKPFYHSEGGHGTNMATYIRFVCPKVRLYIAKLNGPSLAASAAQVSRYSVPHYQIGLPLIWRTQGGGLGNQFTSPRNLNELDRRTNQ